MQFWFSTLTGCFLILAGLGETLTAVLYPRAINGPVTAGVNRIFLNVLKVRWVARSQLALVAGSSLIVIQILCWATLLFLGFSLIAWPQLGAGITATGSQPTDTDLASAVYYAGFTLTTLGVGDLVPRTPAMQLMTVAAAATGFSFFTLVLAYVLAIYSALARRNQFANEIEYRTGRTGNSLAYLRPYCTEDQSSLINQDLCTLSSNMAELLESHHFYPILHYFRFSESKYAMSRMLRFCLEVATIIRAAREAGWPPISISPEAADRLWHASRQMLEETNRHFVICSPDELPADPGLAHELSRSFGGPPEAIGRFTASFAAQQSSWLSDLEALAICTRSNRS